MALDPGGQSDGERNNEQVVVAKHSEIYLEDNPKVPEWRSFSTRSVTLYFEGGDQPIVVGAKRCTKVYEIKEVIAGWFGCGINEVILKTRLKASTNRTRARVQRDQDEVDSEVIVSGVSMKRPEQQQRPKRQYEHPLLVIGAGLGGIQMMLEFQMQGRTDFVCMDKCHDFGGWSWIEVPNKFTKLQTEKGTYHTDFIFPSKPIPTEFGGVKYKNWPSRDTILRMFRLNAAEYGLYQHTVFNTRVERVKPKSFGKYAVQHLPVGEDDGDAEISMVSCVNAWPGFLHDLNIVEFSGEDAFEGYIEYSSFDRLDYTRCVGKEVIVYGHGAFTIENVRTLMEHRVKKATVICRKRNLCGTKMTSWLVGYCDAPVSAVSLLDCFKVMYDLVGFDPWSAFSVQTNESRSYAMIQSDTIFGVTDIYFLAGYFGLMEVVVDDIKRLTKHTVVTKKNTKVNGEVLVKATGTGPSRKVDKELGIKEVVGWWVNGDPLRPVSLGFKGVQAQNFGSFSTGPGYPGQCKQFNWFIDFPDDWNLVKEKLPRHAADNRFPAYCVPASFGMPAGMAISQNIPILGWLSGEAGAIKARKQKLAHPMVEFLAECRREWNAYTRFFRESCMVDDRPDPPYPYTEEIMNDFLEKCGEQRYA